MMKLFAAIGLFAVAIGIILLASMVNTFLWYCCDDQVATLVGNPALGKVPFLNAWAFFTMLTGIFGARATATAKRSD